MTGEPGAQLGARALALRILADVDEGAFVDRALAEREGRLADPRDRRFLHLVVLDALRWAGALDAVVARHVHGGAGRLEPAVRAALRTAVLEVSRFGRPVPIAVSATVDAVRDVCGAGAARLVNAVLRRALSGAGPPRLDERLTIPRWLLARWRRHFGEADAMALLAGINRPARPFLVARPGGAGNLLERLRTAGVEASPSPWHPRGIDVARGSAASTGCFEDGTAVAVDPASALVARLCSDARSRGPVADLAAAPGGKATLIGWDRPGRIAALEKDSGRAARLARTLPRNVPGGRAAVIRADAGAPPLAGGSFAVVLLDAPCSGTGTLRRRPDRRWRVSEQGIRSAARTQARLLEAAARLVAPGGVLVYSVCSLEPEEGAGLVGRFLERTPRFVVDDPRASLPACAQAFVGAKTPFLATRPDRAEIDGFFAARLVARGGLEGAGGLL